MSNFNAYVLRATDTEGNKRILFGEGYFRTKQEAQDRIDDLHVLSAEMFVDDFVAEAKNTAKGIFDLLTGKSEEFPTLPEIDLSHFEEEFDIIPATVKVDSEYTA